MELNHEQKAAVGVKGKNVLVLAPPGSGKTRVIVERTAYLIEQMRVSPYSILLVTFTRKAAGEMRARLEGRIGMDAQKLTIGTFHSVALRLLHQFGDLIGFRKHNSTVYGDFEEQYLLREVAIDLGFHTGKSWKNIKKKEIDAVFAKYYQEGIEPDRFEPGHALFKAFIQRCRENNSYTYGGLITGLKLLLPQIHRYLNWTHIITDESQDTDRLQWDLLRTIQRLCDTSLFCVCDTDQCQPAGTMVLLEDLTEIDIADLDPKKHKLRIYDKHDALIYGGYNKGYSFSKAMRLYSGKLYTITAGRKKTKCTINHKWWVKWSTRSTEKNVVYLMRSGDRFRIGWCQLFRKGKGNVHLWVRAKIEKADAVWILKAFDSKKEASGYEQVVSVKHGLPTIMFEPTNGATHYDRECIDSVFQQIGDLKEKAEKCLDSHGRSIKHPFWIKEKKHAKQGKKNVFDIVTYNLIDGLFMVPVRKNLRNIEWIPASIIHEDVLNLPVYSLNVEKYHTYVADGICTRNSIYGFRGADTEYLIRHQDDFAVFKLKINYRSDGHIVNAANKLIAHNERRIPKNMEAIKSAETPIKMLKNRDSSGIVKFIQSMNGSSNVVLARNHILLRKLSQLLTEANINHIYIGEKTALTNSEEFRRFHAFLKLMVNPWDNFSFLLIRDLIGLSRKEYNEIREKAVIEGISHFQAWEEEPWDKLGVYDLLKLVPLEKEGLQATIDLLDACLDDLGWTNYAEDIIPFIESWISNNPTGTIQEYLNWLATYDIQEEIREDHKGLQLMTIHAAKGLEWPEVIIAGANEGLIPSKQAINADDIEAERRLMYVAITRAENELIITSRPEITEGTNGKTYVNPVSRFIQEIQ